MPPEFAFSCYHGVVESVLIEKGLDAIAAARDACYTHVKGTETEIGGGCIHGIGHGIVSFERLDLTKALAWCDVLSEEDSRRPKDFRFPDTDYCGEGVFMEYMNSAPASAFRQESPWHPCDTVPQKYQPRCARIQAQVMRKRFGMENAEIAEACAKAPEPRMTLSCLEGIGIHVARNVPGGDFEEIRRGCGEIEENDLRDQCLSIAAREVIHQNYPAWQTTSQKLCTEVKSPETQHACKERLERNMAIYGKIYGW